MSPNVAAMASTGADGPSPVKARASLASQASMTRRASMFASRRTLGSQMVGTLVTCRTTYPRASSGGSSSFSIWANLTSALIGGGLLEMGNAFKMSGFFAVVLVVGLSGLCAWTMVLITRCLQKAEEVVPEEEREDEPLDWPLIGQAALGRPGKLLVGTIFLGDLLMSILTFQVLCGTTLKVIFPSLSLTLLICLSGVLTLLMLLVPEEHLGLASSAGIVATLVFVVAVVVSGACMDERPAATEYKAIDAAGIPGAMAIVVFSMVAHAEAPTIYQPLENKAAFGKISAGAFAVAISMYVAVGIFGYWAYAGDVHPNLLDNLGLNLDGQVAAGLGWLRKLAAALFAAKLQVVQPILLTPVAAMLDVAILGAWPTHAAASDSPRSSGSSGQEEDDRSTAPGTDSADSGKEDSAAVRESPAGQVSPRVRSAVAFATRTISTIVFVILGVLLQDHLELLTSLTGSTCSLAVAVTFPVLFYLKLSWKELGLASRVFLALLGLAGLLLQIVGTIKALMEIV